MRVELDLFSGRENPSWELPESDVRQLIDRFAGRAVAPLETVEGVLGFRGYIITVEDDAQAAVAGLPEAFRITGLGLGGVTPQEAAAPTDSALPVLRPQEVDEAALWLLDTARQAVEDDLLAYVEGVVKARAEAQGPEPEVDMAAGCAIQNTAYNPAFWNRPEVQPRNNCYNYAMNYRSDTFAQPGRISGQMYTALTCASVGAAADRDGCRATCTGSSKTVALVIWPGRDFHWYRLHSNGFWGHKPGSTPARNTDNRGRVIGGGLTPYNCDRGPYTQFCGYRFSPTGMRVR